MTLLLGAVHQDKASSSLISDLQGDFSSLCLYSKTLKKMGLLSASSYKTYSIRRFKKGTKAHMISITRPVATPMPKNTLPYTCKETL